MKCKQAFMYGPHDLRIEEVELPPLRDDQILIKLKACGICQPQGVIGDATKADWHKAEEGVKRTLDYLEKLVNDILEKYPAGELPPIDKMTQRKREDIEAVIKGPNEPGGRHIYTLAY